MFGLVAAAVIVLPGIARYPLLSHRPLTRDQLTEVRGHTAKWSVAKHQTKGTLGGPSSETADPVIYTGEHRTSFVVSSSF